MSHAQPDEPEPEVPTPPRWWNLGSGVGRYDQMAALVAYWKRRTNTETTEKLTAQNELHGKRQALSRANTELDLAENRIKNLERELHAAREDNTRAFTRVLELESTTEALAHDVVDAERAHRDALQAEFAVRTQLVDMKTRNVWQLVGPREFVNEFLSLDLKATTKGDFTLTDTKASESLRTDSVDWLNATVDVIAGRVRYGLLQELLHSDHARILALDVPARPDEFEEEESE